MCATCPPSEQMAKREGNRGEQCLRWLRSECGDNRSVLVPQIALFVGAAPRVSICFLLGASQDVSAMPSHKAAMLEVVSTILVSHLGSKPPADMSIATSHFGPISSMAEPPVGYVARSFEGDAALLECPWGFGSAWLVNLRTHERVSLPDIPDGAEWDFEVGDAGALSLVSQSQRVAVADVFDLTVWAPQDDLDNAIRFMIRSAARRRWQRLTDVAQRHITREAIVSLDLEGRHGAEIKIDIGIFAHSPLGASVWWSFECMWNEVLPNDAQATASRSWWKKLSMLTDFEEELGLTEGHARSAHPFCDAPAPQIGRVLPFHALSTHLFVGCLARWACGAPNRGGLRDLEARSSCHRLLSALVHNSLAGQPKSLSLILDEEVDWSPPLAPMSDITIEFNSAAASARRRSRIQKSVCASRAKRSIAWVMAVTTSRMSSCGRSPTARRRLGSRASLYGWSG